MYRLDTEEMLDFYKKNVSGGNYPISLDLANYLYDLCWKVKPNRILDRGSGFSSFVFRKYATMSARNAVAGPNYVKIYSVDHDERWLEKSKEFVKYCGLTPRNFFLWEDFLNYNLDAYKYDMILDDYHFPLRVKNLHVVLDMLAVGGYLILDDVHHKNYRNAIIRTCRKYNVTVRYLKNNTALIRRKG